MVDKMHSDNLSAKIAEEMKRLLQDKEHPDSSFLSARLAAERFNCSRQTANNALNILVEDGLLTRKAGGKTQICRKKKAIHIACLVEVDLKRFSPVAYYKYAHVINILLQNLEKNSVKYTIFSFKDLQRANFSPRLFDKFDALVADTTFNDKNSLQLINNFQRPKLWPWPTQFLCESGNQIVFDVMAPFCEIFRQARLHGIRKCYLHYFSEYFLQIMKNAMIYNGFENSDQVVVEYNECSQLSGYKKGLVLEYAPDILHVTHADYIAWGIFEAFTDRGGKPGDFHVTGSGDTESFGIYPLQQPCLTSINVPYEEGIDMGVKLLLRQINEKSSVSEVVRMPGKVVFRESAFYDKNKKIKKESKL